MRIAVGEPCLFCGCVDGAIRRLKAGLRCSYCGVRVSPELEAVINSHDAFILAASNALDLLRDIEVPADPGPLAQAREWLWDALKGAGAVNRPICPAHDWTGMPFIRGNLHDSCPQCGGFYLENVT